MTERGLVDVEIIKNGDDAVEDGYWRAVSDVKVKTWHGVEVWVREKDVYARKPSFEE